MSTSLRRIVQILRLETAYADVDERDFCRKWMQNVEGSVYRTAIPLCIVWDVVMLLILHTFAHPENVPLMRIIHVLHLATTVGTWYLQGRPRALKAMTSLSTSIYAVGFGILAYRCHALLGDVRHQLMGATGFLAACFVNQQANGFDKRLCLSHLALCVATAVVAMGTSPGGAVWVGVFSVLLGSSSYLHLGRIQRASDEAVREYRLRGKIAPAHIVRKTAGNEANLDAQFQPQERRAICISSDWRNYQKLSKNLEPQLLGEALNGYYDICYDLLKKAFPQGNYYTDWIADELFIVIFVEAGENEKALVNKAVAFAESLIRGKETFRERFGLPAAIDVGISNGSALIGMMGPEGFRKATALGEIPGRARRLQSCGKLLRAKFGEADRVIFDHAVLMTLNEAFDVRTFDAEAPSQLRDLAFSTLYFVEPVRRGGADLSTDLSAEKSAA